METNTCDVSHLPSEVLLPPRKRLLARFKKQNSDGNESSSLLKTPSSSDASASCNVQTHLNNLLASHLNNSNVTPEEIAEASRSAATAAIKAAKAVRAAADDKAAIAAEVVAAAKSALDLVASFPEEATCRERYLKKNHKLKKNVPVESLYTKEDQPRENHSTDKELARRLHRARNSFPRILMTCSVFEEKGHRHKKHKALGTSENSRFSNEGSIVWGETVCSMHNGHGTALELHSDSSKADEKEPVYDQNGVRLELDNMEAESCHPNEKTGKKQGRVKLKKLPLSMFNSRDQLDSKQKGIAKSSRSQTENNSGNLNNDNKPLFQSGAPSKDDLILVMSATTWKCQDLKAPECVKQNKVVRS